MHREFTSSYIAKFVIEKDRMYVENASRAISDGFITPENLEPNPKNPIIASFFRNIGLADTLGSGTRKLFKYSRYYSGKDPEFKEGDVFRIVVPLDDTYSYDFGLGNGVKNENAGTISGTISDTNQDCVSDVRRLLQLLARNPKITQKQIHTELNLSLRTVKRLMAELQSNGRIVRIGNNRSGEWYLNNENETI